MIEINDDLLFKTIIWTYHDGKHDAGVVMGIDYPGTHGLKIPIAHVAAHGLSYPVRAKAIVCILDHERITELLGYERGLKAVIDQWYSGDACPPGWDGLSGHGCPPGFYGEDEPDCQGCWLKHILEM